ncbi:MAG: serine/threonine-protein kinase, partial [Planctomycetales bacterium]
MERWARSISHRTSNSTVKVALKIPQFGGALTSGLLERFYREARAAGNLRHPGICPVFDVGEIDGQHFITMAFIEGRPLRDFSKSSKRQADKQTARVIRKIAMAMAEAHDQNVIHRDLKPANIMIDTKNEPVVMDFGLARRAAENEEKLTHTGTVIGTPAYMSPEQVDGDNENVGPPADIYSLGVVFYELLTGELPFKGNLMSILKQISMKQPRPPVQLHADVDPFLQNLCLKMLEKEAKDRPESMHAVAQSLSEWLQGLHAPTDESGMLETSRVPDKKDGLAESIESTNPMTTPGMPRSEPEREEFPTMVEPPGLSATAVTPSGSASSAEKPPIKNRKLLAIGGFGCAALLLAGITFFINLGDKYNVKITVDDPSISLKVDGDDVLIEGAGSTIRLSAGMHTVRMERDGLEAEEFTVRKDGKNIVHVAIVDGTFAIVKARLNRPELVPPVSPPANTQPSHPSQAASRTQPEFALQFDGQSSRVEIPEFSIDVTEPFTIEFRTTPANTFAPEENGIEL